MRTLIAGLGVGLALWLPAGVSANAERPVYDVLIQGGTIYDGSGGPPYIGDVAIRKDRLVYVGPTRPGTARERFDAHGKAVAPGFVNMLAHPEESLIVDGRALSDLRQGVTLEVLGENSMGPLSASMRERALERQADIRYPIDWHTLGRVPAQARAAWHRAERRLLCRRGNGAHRGARRGGRGSPRPHSSTRCVQLVRQAMEEGAVGVTTALIYAPNTYAGTPELVALASEAARCGGIYSAHMRSEGDRLLEAVQETIDISARLRGAGRDLSPEGGRPAQLGQDRCADPHRGGARAVTARASPRTCTCTPPVPPGSMPRCRRGCRTAASKPGSQRLKDPQIRARVIQEMRDPAPSWENLFGEAGAQGTLLLAFKNPELKALTGKTLAAVAQQRGVSPRGRGD